MRSLGSFLKTTGTATVLSTGAFVVEPAFSQASPSPRMVLLHCIDAIEDPGRPADQRCARQAIALCHEQTTPEVGTACERALACGFLADGRVLAHRSGNRGERPGTFLRDWGKVSRRCARLGAKADDCRRMTAREWWISARGGARLAGVDLSSDIAEVGSCSLE